MSADPSVSSVRRYRFVVAGALLLLFALATAVAPARAVGAPTVDSDQPDYNPGQVVTLSGTGWDPDGSSVDITVRAVGDPWAFDVSVEPRVDGTFETSFPLPPYFVPSYDVEALQTSDGGALRATTTFTDANPSASLSQCANDPAPSPSTDGCSGGMGQQGWVNGNVNAAKAHYFEGDSVPYRVVMDDLSTAGSHVLSIEWDTTQGGKHALDYLTSFDRTVATADPCLGVAACGSPSTFPIPSDPQVTVAGVTPDAGMFTLYGGVITGVSAYSGGAAFPIGNNVRGIEITFTASVANPVMAWGGHIATRADWGSDNAAVAISGSPFHMRLNGLNGQGGSQDRALSAEAVTYPGSITITKAASPEGDEKFPFTATPEPLEAFTLVDDGSSSATRAFTGITDFKTYTVTEAVPAGWNLDDVACMVSGGVSTDPPSTATNELEIVLKEGDEVACTFANTKLTTSLIVIKEVTNDHGGTAEAGEFTFTIGGVETESGVQTLAGAIAPGTEIPLATAGAYDVTETDGPSGYKATYSAGCSGEIAYGETRTCTVTNDDIAPKLIVIKDVVDGPGGMAVPADFTMSSGGVDPTPATFPGASAPGTEVFLSAGAYEVTEDGPDGYRATFSGDCVGTIAIGEEKTCTVTNTRLGTLTIEKELPIVGDPGLFDLLLDDSALVEDIGDGGTTGPQSLEPGTYTVAEAAGTDTTLDAYRTTVTCEDQKGVFIDAESATKIDVDVADGQDVVCVFENTLRGTLTAKKALVPAGDPGLFDLAIEDGDGVIASATDVGDGGSVGPVYLDGGTYVVAEAAGSGTDLAAYTSIVDCVSDVPNGMEKTIVPRQIAGPSQMVELADGENVVCTFTNTRKGTLTVEKELDPVDDPGLFDLQIDDQTLATDVGDGGTTGPQIVDAGTHTVAELAGTETDLAAYGTTVTCIDGVETLIDAAPVTSTEVAIVDGQNVTCTFTNIRKGTLTVVKNLIPASDTGTFDLQIDGTTLAAAVGDGGTTGAQIVDAGTYAVGEAGANGTLLSGYISSVACTDGVETVVTATGTSAEVPVVNGQDIVCTITNTADTGPIVPAGTPDVVPPVIVPPVTPVATVRGAARLRGPRGCIKPGRILTRVTGRNMARVVFVRNGRVVKRVKLNSTNVSTLRAVVLRTRIRPSNFRRYRVVARVTYVQGATPRAKTMVHTFRQCGRSSVTG